MHDACARRLPLRVAEPLFRSLSSECTVFRGSFTRCPLDARSFRGHLALHESRNGKSAGKKSASFK